MNLPDSTSGFMSPEPAPPPLVVRMSARDRQQAIEEARRKHYQDQPFLTSALTGTLGGAAALGLGAPALDSYMHGRPFQASGSGAGVGAVVGLLSGLLMEAAGRGMTRTVGPDFRPARWMRDQDPHRWNSALRLAPLGALLLARSLSPSFSEAVNGKL